MITAAWVISNWRYTANKKSEIELWILTTFLVLGWGPRPQDHGELFRSQIGPLFRPPPIFKDLITYFWLIVNVLYGAIMFSALVILAVHESTISSKLWWFAVKTCFRKGMRTTLWKNIPLSSEGRLPKKLVNAFTAKW